MDSNLSKFAQVFEILLFECLSCHVIVRLYVEDADFERYCCASLLVKDFLDAHPLNILLLSQIRLFELRKVALLRHNPAHAVNAKDVPLPSQEAFEDALNEHNVAVDGLSRPQEGGLVSLPILCEG